MENYIATSFSGATDARVRDPVCPPQPPGPPSCKRKKSAYEMSNKRRREDIVLSQDSVNVEVIVDVEGKQKGRIKKVN